MPSKSINLDMRHLSYIETYAEKQGVSESKATRELLDVAIEVDRDA